MRYLHPAVSVILCLLGCSLFGQEGYWAPPLPPKAKYRIDAAFDLPNHRITGRGTVTFENTGSRPMEIIAVDWRLSATYKLQLHAGRSELTPINTLTDGFANAPLFYRLPSPLSPGGRIELNFMFSQSLELAQDFPDFGNVKWYPRLWWNGLPVHDAFSVKLDIPEGYAAAVSGKLDPKSGRYETEGVKTFGVYLGRDMITVTRESAGVEVKTLATAKGEACAAVCMETALDAIAYYKQMLGFYPFDFLNIIPGGDGRWGGYPFATGIVVIHGQETYRAEEQTTHWQRITAHEIGHEYWGEWVMDADDPAWVWIGMGIFADTEYDLARGIDPNRRQGWMSNYLSGLRNFYDTTVDIPPHIEANIEYDRNNTVIHSKGYSIVSALDAVLGRETFLEIYKKILKSYGGRRLDWRTLQSIFEEESGQDLSWFFKQWVRSNAYLCYQVECKESKQHGNRFISTVSVKRMGTMSMPVPVKAVFEDGSSKTEYTRRDEEKTRLTFESSSPLKEVVLNPEHKLAMLEEPLPPISARAAEKLAWGWSADDVVQLYEFLKDENLLSSDMWYRFGVSLYEEGELDKALDCFKRVDDLHDRGLMKFAAHGWMGLIHDLEGDREMALKFYRSGLKLDTGEVMNHSRLGLRMDREWFEERLKTPYTYETAVEIPENPNAGDLQAILNSLGWQREGRTPLLIYEKTKGVKIDQSGFWFKLGLLLYDSGFYSQSYSAFQQVLELESTPLSIFTAYTWLGHLKDLMGEREAALTHYREALAHDTGDTMTHSQYHMRINREWVEKRLASPFARR